MPLTRRKWISGSVFGVLTAMLSSCGTLLYPERRGQSAGRLDWKVIFLDGIGLLFFFIPGVIAFAVDFLNGTIYLPSGSVPVEPPCTPTPTAFHPHPRMTSKKSRLVPVKLARRQLTPVGIERVVTEKTGETISLEDGKYLSRKMRSIDEFWKTHDEFDTHSLGRR